MPLSRTGRAVLVGVLVAASSSFVLPSASAHASLVSSSPTEGAVLDAAPKTLTLTFTDELMDVAPALVVLDSSDDVVSEPEATIDGDTLKAAGPADLPDGDYVIGWRVVSADGHPIDGRIDFTIAGSGAAGGADGDGPAAVGGDDTEAPDAAATHDSAATSDDAASSETADASETDSAASPWPFVASLIAVIAVLVAAAVWLARRRRTSGTTADHPTSGDSV